MKSIIRKDTINKLGILSQNQKIKSLQEKNLYQQLFRSDEWHQANVIATTISMPMELSTDNIIKQAWLEGKVVVVPKTRKKGEMDFFELRPETECVTTSFGVSEPINSPLVMPSQIDLMIVPGVAFSMEGYRIGFGGGFYDRYLTNFKGETVSLVFDEQIQPDLSPEIFDIPVNKILRVGHDDE